jgi:AAA+ ATPase superfamily predicted ATPase
MGDKIVQAGKPASGHNFIGREQEVKIISQLLSMGQSVVLIAPRRFGKTSLVLEILRKMKSPDLYTAYVDVFSSPTIELLSTQIIEAVLKNHKLDKIFTKSRNSAIAMMKNLTHIAAYSL